MGMLKVPLESAGERIDVFLARQYPDYSRSFIQKWLKKGGAKRGQTVLAPDDRLKGGETLALSDFEAKADDAEHKTTPTRTEPRYPRSKVVPEILLEDDFILVLNKPPGLVVHPAPSYTGATLIDWLRDHMGSKVSKVFTDPERLGLVHRLDKDTSGVLMIAKSVKAQIALSRQFQDRTVHKTYLAWVEGVPASKEGWISAPVGRSKKDPTKMMVSGSGRPSETNFEVVETLKEVSLLSLHPKTGRTHQIRVHTSTMGHPIVGDLTYGSRDTWAERFNIQRPLLHARQLELTHPGTGKPTVFKADIPADFRAARTAFRKAFAALLLLSVIAGGQPVSAQPESSGSKPAAKAASSGGSQNAAALKSMRREISSLKEQIESLNGEIAALKEQVSGIDAGLSQLDLARRLRDLERALPDMNGKITAAANNAEEGKSQAMDAVRKVKAQQEQADQLRDLIDRLQRQLISQRAREDMAPVPTPASGTTSKP